MSKVRVYDLARQYGIKGPLLAKMLKEFGFEKVKSHMAVLDDATELHARAVIEAQGLSLKQPANTATAEESAEPDDGIPKKKQLLPKKKKLGEAAEEEGPSKKMLPPPLARKPRKKSLEAPDEEVPAPSETSPEPTTVATPAPEASSAPQVEAPETAAPKVEVPEAVTPESSAAAASEVPEKQEAPAATAPEQPAEASAAVTPPAVTPVAETPAAGKPAESSTAATAAKAETSVETKSPSSPAEAGAAAATQPEKAPAPPVKTIKRLLVPQARAQVVGKIDLPKEAINDARRRSAPGATTGGRNPGGVDRNLRRAALRNTQTRSAGGRQAGRVGSPFRRGPAMRGRRGPGGRQRTSGRGGSAALTPTVDPDKLIEIESPTSVKRLSEVLGIKANDLIAALTFKLGVVGKNINSFLSPDEVELVALEVGRNIKLVEHKEAEEELLQDLVSAAKDVGSIQRAPVITFMGHVDHGKTTLLDKLRSSDVAQGESGGITQHVGAYKITREDGYQFVVLDTPGHEAFTAMRARGAQITDIVVLVVAADDGVMPQTEEALAHAKDAGVEIIVAINKSDRPNANATQVMQQLSVKGLQAEEWGGTAQMIPVSALTGDGLPELVERIQLQAELMELTAKPDAAAVGVVLESKQTPEQGAIVNVLVTDGTLRVRDQVLCGESLSRVRSIIDDHGNQLQEAGPSTPVGLIGLTSLPAPGVKLLVVNDKRKAKVVVDDRQRQARAVSLAERSKVTMENLSATLAAEKVDEVKIILKADVMGSLEPIKDSITKLETEEVKAKFIHTALGGITEADVNFAAASGALIIGFNTVADQKARVAAERVGVDIRYYDVIYAILDDMKLALEGLLKPEEVEEALGSAEIRAVFRSSKIGNIAGCYVTDGSIKRNAKVRLSRDGKVIYTGTVSSLRREKDDAKEVKQSYECGLTLKDFNDIKEGDVLDFFVIKLVKRTLP